MSKEQQDDIDELAKEFARLMVLYLGTYQMSQVLLKNRCKAYEKCCASHDYCDSNMVMEEAYMNLFDESPELNDEEVAFIVNNAWDTAKVADFYFDERSPS